MIEKIQPQQKCMSYIHQGLYTKPIKRCNNQFRQFKTRETDTHGFLFLNDTSIRGFICVLLAVHVKTRNLCQFCTHSKHWRWKFSPSKIAKKTYKLFAKVSVAAPKKKLTQIKPVAFLINLQEVMYICLLCTIMTLI